MKRKVLKMSFLLGIALFGFLFFSDKAEAYVVRSEYTGGGTWLQANCPTTCNYFLGDFDPLYSALIENGIGSGSYYCIQNGAWNPWGSTWSANITSNFSIGSLTETDGTVEPLGYFLKDWTTSIGTSFSTEQYCNVMNTSFGSWYDGEGHAVLAYKNCICDEGVQYLVCAGEVYNDTCGEWDCPGVANCATDGACAATHYKCSAGFSIGPAESTTQWQWWCYGLNGGNNVQCAETKIDGACAATHPNCSAGNYRPGSLTEDSTKYQWWCDSPNGARNVLCTEMKNANPFGWHDYNDNASCTAGGWAVDMDVPSQSINVIVNIDGSDLGTYPTNYLRSDVNAALGGISGNHGFTITFPNSGSTALLYNGSTHSLAIYAVNVPSGYNPLLSGSPKAIQCSAPPTCNITGFNPDPVNVGGATTGSYTFDYKGLAPSNIVLHCDDVADAGLPANGNSFGYYPINAGTKTCTVSITTSAGTGSCSRTVTVNAPAAPTCHVVVSPDPVPYGGNPAFTLSSTNAYYCHVLMDGIWDWNVSGYFTSGTFNPGPLTVPGAHSAWCYCYNSAWQNPNGWSITPFTVSSLLASCSVSPNPDPYGGNPGITLNSTNGYYCFVRHDWNPIAEGFFGSGTYYPGAQTTPGYHEGEVYCYNSAWPTWYGSGWNYCPYTVNACTPNPTCQPGSIDCSDPRNCGKSVNDYCADLANCPGTPTCSPACNGSTTCPACPSSNNNVYWKEIAP